MTLTYKYKVVPRSNNIKASSPSIPMTLSGKGGKYEFMVLLDSGADISAIPKHVAELLGLNLEGEKEKTFGIGGEAPAVETKMKIEFGKTHENYSFEIPVKVILSNYDFPPLIGRAIFFDKFNIIFKQNERRVSLKLARDKNY
jgi:predicted aspartyl protease